MHNLIHLSNLAIKQDRQFVAIFSEDTKVHRRCFQLSKNAYVDARYSEHYKIAEEELIWLNERVKKLRALVGELCPKRIALI